MFLEQHICCHSALDPSKKTIILGYYRVARSVLITSCMREAPSAAHAVESLTLRSTPDQVQLLSASLDAWLVSLGPMRGLVDATTYLDATTPGDITVLLRWKHAPGPDGSELAARIEAPLRRHGLVSRCVWIPQRRVDPPALLTRGEKTK